MTRIKKHSSGNHYLLTEQGVWIRNFATQVAPLDINRLSSPSDYSRFLENEVQNERYDVGNFDPKSVAFKGAVIVSDGFDFSNKHKLLEGLPPEIAVIAVNRTLVKWKVPRDINFFLVNNPYAECMNQLPPHAYYPRCLVSTRVYPDFVRAYKFRGGYIERYSPTPEPNYASPINTLCTLDDYRNPVCAAIHLAFRIGIPKLLLLCCDDSFEGERAAAVQLPNGLWTYPQHLMSHGMVAGMLSWYKKIRGVKIGDHSSGPICDDVPYIPEEEMRAFFE